MVEIYIPPGLSRGATPADRQGRWHSSNLVRWYDNVLQAIGGWQRLTSAPLSSTVRRLLGHTSNAGIKYITAATDDGLMVLDGATWFDATPVGFVAAPASTLLDGYGTGDYGTDGDLPAAYGTPRNTGTAAYQRGNSFSLDTFGELVLSVHSTDGKLLLWNPATPTTKAAAVSGAPTANRCMVVTPERHVMLFGAGGNPRQVRWSDREDYSDWVDVDTNTSGSFLLDTESMILTAAEVREGTLAFTEQDVWLVAFTGGDLVYGRERIGSTTILSPASVATFGGRAAWMTRGAQFVLYEAGQVKPLPCEVAAYVASDIDFESSAARAHAAENAMHGEVWFWYVSNDSPDGECDRAVVWSYLSNTWATHSTLARTAMIPNGAHRYPLLAGADRHLYEHESGSLDGSATRVGSVWVESNTMSPGGQVRVQRMQCDGGVPDATTVTIYARDTRDGADLAYGPFTPNAGGRTPVRAGGQDLRIRIEAATDDPAWSVGRFMADVVTVGRR